MAAKRHGATRYAGVLASPIIPPSPPGFVGAVTPKRLEAYRKKVSRHQRTAARALEKEFCRRISLLFKHYGIKNKDMAALAWALAFEHVPGFRVRGPEGKSKRGRKPKWTSGWLDELFETVQSVKQQRFTDRQALTFMVNSPQHRTIWGPPPDHKGSKQQWIETLESRLQEAKHIRRRTEQLIREFQQIAASKKFRK